MNRITATTRRDIFDILNNNSPDNAWLLPNPYPYYGRLSIPDFLKKLYDVEQMKSEDPRFETAYKEIKFHTNNLDYDDDFLFYDDRFELLDGTDKMFLDFLTTIFHPEVRDEKKDWKSCLEQINDSLRIDGYELVHSGIISGKPVYSARRCNSSSFFIPFSERKKLHIPGNKFDMSIPNKARYQLFSIMKENDEIIDVADDFNCYHSIALSRLVYDELTKFYKPKDCRGGNYIDIKEFYDLEKGTPPYVVLDAIEIFSKRVSQQYLFEQQINSIFSINELKCHIKLGEISISNDSIIGDGSCFDITEKGIDERIQNSKELFEKGQYSLALEKVWDAFDRIKTYYAPDLDKKKSSNKIIEDMSGENEAIYQMFNKEFHELKDIGNNFSIRHHEIGTATIDTDLQRKYLYHRCLSLIYAIKESL